MSDTRVLSLPEKKTIVSLCKYFSDRRVANIFGVTKETVLDLRNNGVQS